MVFNETQDRRVRLESGLGSVEKRNDESDLAWCVASRRGKGGESKADGQRDRSQNSGNDCMRFVGGVFGRDGDDVVETERCLVFGRHG